MRIVIVGAGAIGSTIAGYLFATGEHEIALVARGQRLRQLTMHGLSVRSRGRLLLSHPTATDDAATLPPPDVVVLAVKGYSLPALAPHLKPILGPETLVISAQNGIPWWYFFGIAGPQSGQPFPTVDPDAAIWSSIGAERTIGCVVQAAAEIDADGVVVHTGNLRTTLGAPRAGDHAVRLAEISRDLSAAAIEAPVTNSIRHVIWTKLQANLASAPIGVLTGANMGEQQSAPGMLALRGRIMRECLAVARAWDVALADDVDAKLALPSAAPSHKPSMLQDYEAGRPIELDAQITAVVDLARMRDVPVPTIETLWTLTRLRTAL